MNQLGTALRLKVKSELLHLTKFQKNV